MNSIRLVNYSYAALLALWLATSTAMVYTATMGNRLAHAVVSMGSGLVLLWVFGCGILMFLLRERVRAWVLLLPGNWQVKFVLFASLLALTEEAITVSMTNLAPLFGVQVGEAYITASANYLDVVLRHNVIVFIPWFIVWAFLLKRYAFSSFWAFLLTGLNGLLAETLTFGKQHLSEFGLWIFVYGLMVYLPAYSIPSAKKRAALPPKIWHNFLAFLLPLVLSIPWALLINLVSPRHPAIHFPPTQP
jgi:hypothetical protein